MDRSLGAIIQQRQVKSNLIADYACKLRNRGCQAFLRMMSADWEFAKQFDLEIIPVLEGQYCMKLLIQRGRSAH